MTYEEAIPCRNCGKARKSSYYMFDGYQQEPPTFVIECDCGIKFEGKDKDDLIKRWNKWNAEVTSVNGADLPADGLNLTVSSILQNVCSEFCDKYCKYPDQYGEDDADQERMWSERCETCPIRFLI